MTSTPLVSLIVVNFNGEAVLPAFLAALERTRYPAYELIVVDNASTDGSLARVAAWPHPVMVIENRANLGFGRGCNAGAERAAGDFLVFLNPDVVVSPEWLTILVRRLDEHPAAGIISPRTLPSYMEAFVPSAGSEQLTAVPGCALMVRRPAWDALGGFDEEIFLYWEDAELCWRAWLLGWDVLADLEAYVHHDEGGSSDDGRRDGEQLKNGLYTYVKLMPWRRVAAFAAFTAAKTLVKVVALRRPALLDAWLWNVRHLHATLGARRRWARRWRRDPSELARLVAAGRARRMRELVRHRRMQRVEGRAG